MQGTPGTSLAHRDRGRPQTSRPRLARTDGALALWTLLAAGLAIRLAFDSGTAGNRFDLGSLLLVAHALESAPAHVYALANQPGAVVPRWPYPPGFFPVVIAVKWLSGVTGVGFEHFIRLPSILADLVIAWIVQDHLASAGASRGRSLVAAALVALGPVFIAISGVHGQIDAAAILPAAIALTVWERDRSPRRAWLAGLLIGTGAAIKVVPGLMLFALLPSARSRREALVLIGASAIVPFVAIAPMVAAAGTGWLSSVFEYHGGVGLGGIGLVVQPELPLNWLHLASHPANGAATWLLAHGGAVAAASIAIVCAFLMRRRVPAPLAAVIVWLTVYAFGVTFFMQYMVWGLPFFLMAGYIREAAALQLLLLAPVLVIYHGVHHAWEADLFYIAPMLIVWAAMTAALLVLCARVARGPGVATGASEDEDALAHARP